MRGPVRVADLRRRAWLGLLVALTAATVVRATAADDEFIPPEQAFTYTAAASDGRFTVRWKVADGYYLYRKRLGIESDDAATTSAMDAQIAALPIPDRINGLGAVIVRGHWGLVRPREQRGETTRERRRLDSQGNRAI